jgi:hypothetical protein
MHRLRAHRLTTTLVVVLSLLFSQIALAAYVCPAMEPAPSMEEMMAAGMPCEGMDDQQPVLCHQHHSGGVQSAEAIKLPTVAPVAVVMSLQLPFVVHAAEAVGPRQFTRPEARPPPAPLFLSTLRLRV